MSKPIDETGNKYGLLTVLRQAENRKTPSGRSYVAWECQCECGGTIIARGIDLRSGHTKSCGCRKRGGRFINEIGNTYGKLTVIELVGFNNNYAEWLCQCDCGNQTIVKGANLRNGATHSCGCLRSYKEQEIQQLLIKNDIRFKKEYSFSDLWDIDPLRFDFAIFNNNTLLGLIEYNGQQHYLTSPTGYYTQAKINTIRNHDKQKIDYCNKHNIPLLILNKNNYNEEMILEWIKNIKRESEGE